MKTKSKKKQQRLPFLKELEAPLTETFSPAQKSKKSELNLTLFYQNQLFERKTFSCKVKPRHFVGSEGQEMLITFEQNGGKQTIRLPLKTMVGDLVAFITHTISIWHLLPDEKWIHSDYLFQSSTEPKSSFDFPLESIEVLDSQCSIGKLLTKAKGKKIVAIRNQQYNLCALISNEAYELESRQNKEVLTLLNGITEALQDLIKSKKSLEELEKEGSSSIFSPKSSTERWSSIIRTVENNGQWQGLNLAVDQALFLEMLHEMNRIACELFAKKRVKLSEKEKVILMETAIFFDKMKEMRA